MPAQWLTELGMKEDKEVYFQNQGGEREGERGKERGGEGEGEGEGEG